MTNPITPKAAIEQLLTQWNGISLEIEADGSTKLVTEVALTIIQDLPSSQPNLERILFTISQDPLADLELKSKARTLRSLVRESHHYNRESLIRELRLTNWNPGPNKKIAEDRILCAYLSGESSLDLSGLGLTSLPPCIARMGFHKLGLDQLNCSGNELTRLPPLGENLRVLYCQNNKLTQLPFLPERLVILNCSHNLLTRTPLVPEMMMRCDFSENPIMEPTRFELLETEIRKMERFLGRKESNLLRINRLRDNENLCFSILFWIDLLKKQNMFKPPLGNYSLAEQILPIIQKALDDPDFLETIEANLQEATTTCTDKSLFFLNLFTVLRKTTEAKTKETLIEALNGAFVLKVLEKTAEELIKLRIAKCLDRIPPASKEELEKIRKEELELYLLLQIEYKKRFPSLPIETDSMMFEKWAPLTDKEKLWLEEKISEKLINQEEKVAFFASHPAWTTPLSKMHHRELQSLKEEFQSRLSQIPTPPQNQNDIPSEEEMAYTIAVNQIKQEEEEALFNFFKEKTRSHL